MAMWYVAPGNQQVGPLSWDDLVSYVRIGKVTGETLVFGAGMAQWTAARDVPQVAALLTGGALTRAAVPPPLSGRRAHEIAFTISGEDLQFVEVELDPGEAAVAEAGTLMYMTSGVDHAFGLGNLIDGDG